MISKILITLGVIMVCMWMISARGNPKLKAVPNPAIERRKKHLRNTAFVFMLLMASAAGVMIYLEVEQANAVVTVHVVNTQTGASKTYQVAKGQILNDSFTTIDGLQVIVAGIERIEIETR